MLMFFYAATTAVLVLYVFNSYMCYMYFIY